ncbi:MFS transporter [Galactobacter sp.]|uniref:MFS transporter n=1 Tax=Galactobacter sp. TaxID=2676125 RepID=UPI0025C018E5|nr:MFS transporter [Galactobacter sp.]
MSSSNSSVRAGLPTSDDVVQSLPFRWGVQGRIFVIGGLGFMFDAWDVTLNGALIPGVMAEWDLPRATAALLSTANLVGMAVGAVLWGTIADRVGRRKAFTWTLLIFAVFTALGALSPTFWVFTLCRFLAGVGLGGCIPVDYALVGEFTPRSARGKVLTAMDGWWPIGAACAFFVSAWLLALTGTWRWSLAVMILPALLVFWVRRSVPESPLYLASRGQESEARAVVDGLVARTGATPVDYEVVAEKPRAATKVPAWLVQLGRLWREAPGITAVSWALFLTVLLVYYLALNWMPTILTEAGLQQTAALISGAGMAAAGLVGVVVAALLVEKLGRKLLLAVSAPLSAVLLVVVAAALNNPSTAVIWLLVFGALIQVAIPVLYAYVSELYPTHLRASGFGWASTMSRLGAGVGPLVFAWAWPNFGLTACFTVALILVAVAIVAMLFVSPETKGTDLT